MIWLIIHGMVSSLLHVYFWLLFCFFRLFNLDVELLRVSHHASFPVVFQVLPWRYINAISLFQNPRESEYFIIQIFLVIVAVVSFQLKGENEVLKGRVAASERFYALYKKSREGRSLLYKMSEFVGSSVWRFAPFNRAKMQKWIVFVTDIGT